MKKILLSCLILSGLAFASGDVEKNKTFKEKTFEEIKSFMLEKNNERKMCIEKATNKEELKECKPKYKKHKEDKSEGKSCDLSKNKKEDCEHKNKEHKHNSDKKD